MPLSAAQRPTNHVTAARNETIGRVMKAKNFPFVPEDVVVALEARYPMSDVLTAPPGYLRDELVGRVKLIQELRDMVDSYADFTDENLEEE